MEQPPSDVSASMASGQSRLFLYPPAYDPEASMVALIGYSGFVGSSLLRQADFTSLYRSQNIEEICGQSFDTVICAGAPGQKWLANQHPHTDRENIRRLIDHIATIRCDRFVLISTVDVFKTPTGVDENTPIDESGLSPYGLHRRQLESFVAMQFPNHLIVRLPGLVGPGLRKNIVFDLLNDNNLSTIDSRGVFQFYPMANLWQDIQLALASGLKLVHFAAEPIGVAQLSREGFAKEFCNPLDAPLTVYDMQTRHAQVFGMTGRYQYRISDTLRAVRDYARTEPTSRKIATGVIA